MTSHNVAHMSEEDILKVELEFKKWDKDGRLRSGNIDRADLISVLKMIKADFTDEEIESIMSAADRNKDGVVNCKEFISWLYQDISWLTATDMQLVYFHCRERSEEVSVFCKAMSNPNIKRHSKKIEIPVCRCKGIPLPDEIPIKTGEILENCPKCDIPYCSHVQRKWRLKMSLSLPVLPTPYTKETEEEFWEDVDHLLAASLANHIPMAGPPEAGVPYKTEVTRLPALLVTDSEELVVGLGDVWIRSMLADAVGLESGDILPCILWSTFKLLCGGLVVKAPRECHFPFPYAKVDQRPREVPEPDVHLGLGTYIQKTNGVESVDPNFGTRVFVLFSDGFCSYVATSPDGLRGVTSHGEWDVINGSLVLGCGAGDPLPMQLNMTEQTRPIGGAKRYDQPIHIRLTDIPELFDAPRTLTDCVPRFSKDIRANLLEDLWLKNFDALCRRAALGTNKKHMPGPRETGLLRPGHYTYGQRGEKSDFSDVEIKFSLYAAGELDYIETSMNGVITIHESRQSVWFVEDGQLILTGKKKEGKRVYPLLFQKFCNSRTFEEKLGFVKIPIWIIRERFHFEPFREITDPFLGYQLVSADTLMCGIIHPKSAGVMIPPHRSDRMPLKRMEIELGAHNFDVSEYVSDLSCIDVDHDGHISVKELMALEDFGNIHDIEKLANLEELREGLLMTFETLQKAFCALAGSQDGKLKKVDFEMGLRSVADEELKPGDKGRLREWVKAASIQDLYDAFNALDLEKTGSLDWEDFSTLHYHGSRHFLCLIEHFRTFLFDFFEGTNDECINKAFVMLSMNSGQSLSKQDFVQACASRLCYPHEDAAKATFGFLDRTFNGFISKSDFEYLKSFDMKVFLHSLGEFHGAIITKLSSLDNCFNKFVEEERRVSGERDAKYVRYGTFERMVKKHRIPTQGLDLKQMFLFIDQITGSDASGALSFTEFRLLRAFESKAVIGIPAKLRKYLVTRFGSLDDAFQTLYQAWLPKEMRGRMEAMALRQIVSNCGFVEKTKKNIGVLRATLKLGNFGRLSQANNRLTQSTGALLDPKQLSGPSPAQKKARRKPYIPDESPFEVKKWEPSYPDLFDKLRERPPHFKEGFPNNMGFPGGRPAVMSAVDWERASPPLWAGVKLPRKQVPWTTL